MKTLDDALIRRARALDPGALAEIYERHLDGIYRYIYARIGHQADAEDLTEQVFLKMVDAIPGYRSRGVPFSSWLYRIAHNLVVDRYRRSGRTTLQLTEAVEDRGPYADPEGRFEFGQDRSRLLDAIRQLTPDQQQVIAMRFIDNLDVQDVAHLLRRRPGAIHALQYRALNSLQRILRSEQRAGVQRAQGGRRG
ncbi:MAG TPA: sigma-70 family RNA polymerase sigma factor [Candidatus Limnocylindrales bacterium]|nr:sigma-70 family RNA polymerase sigma factor [Candidatus Limnocylindrales bacterium]